MDLENLTKEECKCYNPDYCYICKIKCCECNKHKYGSYTITDVYDSFSLYFCKKHAKSFASKGIYDLNTLYEYYK